MAVDSKKKFIDYYQVLQVWPTASADVIKKSYFKLAKLHHPDVASKSAGEVKDDEIDFALINEAFAVLNDPAKRRQFDDQLKKRGGSGDKKEADKRSAILAYGQAKTAMKSNHYDKAVVLLRSAVKYDPTNPTYLSWYGFALAALKTNLHEARDACKKALQMEFYNPEFYANLGYVYHRAGLHSTAQECFGEALKWDPENSLALRHLHATAENSKGFLSKLLSFFGLTSKESPRDGANTARTSTGHMKPFRSSQSLKKYNR
ncbi:MAG: DnaJ domain-containing protein [Candidatus Latescibacterota bacterium]